MEHTEQKDSDQVFRYEHSMNTCVCARAGGGETVLHVLGNTSSTVTHNMSCVNQQRLPRPPRGTLGDVRSAAFVYLLFDAEPDGGWFQISQHETKKIHTIGCFVVWSAAHSPLLWLHRHKEPKLGASLPWVGGGEEALLFDPDQQPAGPA